MKHRVYDLAGRWKTFASIHEIRKIVPNYLYHASNTCTCTSYEYSILETTTRNAVYLHHTALSPTELIYFRLINHGELGHDKNHEAIIPNHILTHAGPIFTM